MLKIEYISTTKAYCWCPYHKDHKDGGRPSVAINLTGEHAGQWYCFSCHKAGTISKEAVEKMSKHKKHKEPLIDFDWSSLVEQYGNTWFWMQDPKPKPLDVGLDTLIFVDCGWDGEAWTFPCRNEKNEIIGVQRRFPDGFKCMIEGSQLGLFIPQITFNPEVPLLITEGVSDLCTVLDLGYQGVGRPNNDACLDMVVNWITTTYKFPSSVIGGISWAIDKNLIYIISDNDEPGIKGSIKLAELLNLHGSHVLLPPSKDIRKYREDNIDDVVVKWLKESIK